MSELALLVPSLQRTVAVPGMFETVFPETLEDDLFGVLLDAFAEAQLDGWFTGHDVTDTGTVTPDLERPHEALVVLYAAVRVLTAEIRSRRTHIRYEAAGSVFEEDQSATMLVQLLRDMNARKLELRDQARRGDLVSAFVMADLYVTNALNYPPPNVVV